MSIRQFKCRKRLQVERTLSRAALLVLAGMAVAAPAAAQSPPPIRLTESNRVPACVTPSRLMAFLRERNPSLDPRYDDIARLYKTHGEAWRVRWDYAFFQMIIETNHLMFHNGNGRAGDVKAKQNNFAGLGTTGGGVPGDGYPDVSTGVLAQIQHLVAYSGERMEKPVAPRTQLKQDDIIAASARLRRPVTFADLAGRWAADRRYARSIEWVADRFRGAHCRSNSPIPDDPEPKAVVTAAPQLVKRPIHVARQPTADGGCATALAKSRCRAQLDRFTGRMPRSNREPRRQGRKQQNHSHPFCHRFAGATYRTAGAGRVRTVDGG